MGGGNVVAVHSEEEFNKHLSGAGNFGSSTVAIVDFTATWCGPCQQVAPLFEQLSTQYPNVKFLKVDVDELQEVAAEKGVRAMPTFMAFVNGEKVEEIVGADVSKLKAVVQKLSQQAGPAGQGQKLGGSEGATAGDEDDRRSKLAAAAEARMNAA